MNNSGFVITINKYTIYSIVMAKEKMTDFGEEYLS